MADVGDLLTQENLLEAAVLDRLRADAEAAAVPLVGLIVDRQLVPEDAIADALARRLGTVVLDLTRGALDPTSVELLPEHVAQCHLALAMAPDPATSSLRVAFADPMDRAAIQAVERATGYTIHPLVATVSGVRWAIEREYRSRNTQVSRPYRGRVPTPTMAPLTTIPPAGPSSLPAGKGTVPMRRLEQDATIEQRHEALLLALIECGAVTRAEYVHALERLLGRTDS